MSIMMGNGKCHNNDWMHVSASMGELIFLIDCTSLILLFGNIYHVSFDFFPHFLEAPGVPYSAACEVVFSWRRGKKA